MDGVNLLVIVFIIFLFFAFTGNFIFCVIGDRINRRYQADRSRKINDKKIPMSEEELKYFEERINKL